MQRENYPPQASNLMARQYKCMYCTKTFDSGRALGGHQHSHRRVRDAVNQILMSYRRLHPYTHSNRNVNVNSYDNPLNSQNRENDQQRLSIVEEGMNSNHDGGSKTDLTSSSKGMNGGDDGAELDLELRLLVNG